MNWQSIVVLVTVAAAFGLSIFFTVKKRGSSCGCSCAHCGKDCKYRK